MQSKDYLVKQHEEAGEAGDAPEEAREGGPRLDGAGHALDRRRLPEVTQDDVRGHPRRFRA